jgi:curved DNA-binding protein CbpA
MDARARLKTEIDTIHELLPELDYYKVLLLEPDCIQDEIGDAFRRESRRLHPDRMTMLRDDAVQSRANDIYRLVNEAHGVLKDPDQRAEYDQLLEQGILRMTEGAKAEAEAAARKNDPEHAATHPKAEKYWKMALRDYKEENWGACVMNIQFAMNFEKDNEVFKEWLGKAKEARAEADAKKEKNPYKLRIV